MICLFVIIQSGDFEWNRQAENHLRRNIDAGFAGDYFRYCMEAVKL